MVEAVEDGLVWRPRLVRVWCGVICWTVPCLLKITLDSSRVAAQLLTKKRHHLACHPAEVW